MLYVIVNRLFDECKMMTEVPFNYIVLGENTSYLDRTNERKLYPGRAFASLHFIMRSQTCLKTVQKKIHAKALFRLEVLDDQ